MYLASEILGSFIGVVVLQILVEYMYKKTKIKTGTTMFIVCKYITVSMLIYFITYITNMVMESKVIYLFPIIVFTLYEILKLRLDNKFQKNEQIEVDTNQVRFSTTKDVSVLKSLVSNPVVFKILGFMGFILLYFALNFILVFAQDVYHANDISVYKQFEEELNNQKNQLSDLKDQCISLEQSLNEEYEWIEENRDLLHTNEEVDDYNLRIDNYNEKLGEYNRISDTYNHLVDKYNSDLKVSEELYKKAYDRWYLIPIPMPRAAH